VTDPAVIIRAATIDDLGAAVEIFNDAILQTTGSFDSEPKTADALADRVATGDPRLPMFVAEVTGRVVGWANIGRYSDRCTYGDTGEVSIYVAPDFKGRGVGTLLLRTLVEAGRSAGLHTLIARIGEGNPASLALHARARFEEVGFLKEIGFKFGRRLGVHVLQVVL
jgi:phosphinothricin acetyltransferase